MFFSGIEVTIGKVMGCFCNNNYVGGNFELRSEAKVSPKHFNRFMPICDSAVDFILSHFSNLNDLSLNSLILRTTVIC